MVGELGAANRESLGRKCGEVFRWYWGIGIDMYVGGTEAGVPKFTLAYIDDGHMCCSLVAK